MPSSHAQFVAFWSVSCALFLLVRHRPVDTPARLRGRGGASSSRPWSVAERVAVSAAAAALAALTAWSRVYLGYHTPRQVVAGCAAGLLSAVAWFVVVEAVRYTGWLAWALDTPPARTLRMRDLVVEEDPCQAGWEKWEEKRVVATTGHDKAKAK